MNIIDLAKQAEEYANNVVQSDDNDYSWGFLRDQKFAALVEAAARADEREECAKECERMMMYPNAKQESAAHQNVWAAAKAIRARSGVQK